MHNIKNYLNINLTVMLLQRVLLAIVSKKFELGQSEVSRYGVCDDFLYSEYLADDFEDLNQVERLAIMQIIRTTINSSAQCYFKLLDDGEYQYDDFGIDMDSSELDDFIEQLTPED